MQTILVVDDEPTVRQVLHDVLADEGYHVLVAASGPQALTTLTTVVVDVIVSDLMMPGMSGEHVLTTLRADPRFATLPVVLMSAAPPPATLPLDPRTRFLAKPWTIPQLLDTIAALLICAPFAGSVLVARAITAA
jgi:CheY-like chemotaxis protein